MIAYILVLLSVLPAFYTICTHARKTLTGGSTLTDGGWERLKEQSCNPIFQKCLVIMSEDIAALKGRIAELEALLEATSKEATNRKVRM